MPASSSRRRCREVGEVRRRLDVHPRPKDHPSGRDGREHLLRVRLPGRLHRRPGLGAEVLNDDLLHVPVPTMHLSNGEQRLGPLAMRLADPDQDPRCEGDRQAAGILERAQPHGGDLVGRAEVRSAALREPLRRGLEHDAHRGAHVLQAGHLLPRHDAGVQVREQARLLDHADRRGSHVVERRCEPSLLEPRPRRRVSLLGAVAEGEQRLLAAEPPTGLGDGDHLLRGEERRGELRRRLRERAVVAVVAAEHRERNEDLAGVGHRAPVPQLAEMRGDRAQPLELDAARLQQRFGLVDRQRLPGLRARERPTSLLWGGCGHRPRAYYHPRTSLPAREPTSRLTASPLRVPARALGPPCGPALQSLELALPGIRCPMRPAPGSNTRFSRRSA